MESEIKIKKLFLDQNLKPVRQNNFDGTVIMYSSNEGSIKYELTYHYFMR